MFKTGLAAVAAACALSGAAQAAETAADWLKPPTPEDLMAVWPADAWRDGKGGRAVIGCTVNVHGALHGCSVVSETPAGLGFGAAGVALTPQLLMKPATVDGKPVASNVRIPINFVKPDVPLGTRIPGARGVYGGSSRQVLSNVSWEAAPTYAQVAAAYPAKAREKQVGGRVALNCRFLADGKVGNCETLKEEPEGLGFASAAKSLVGAFQGPAVLSDQKKTVGIQTQIPFTFGVEMLDPTKRLNGKPQWASLPSGDDVMAGYPEAAIKAGVRQARVVLVCEVGAGGRLADCRQENETPTGLGFGQSALALAGAFEVRPWTAEGLPTIGGRIRVPLRYNLPEEEAPPPVSGSSAP